ncbi:p-hydroxybenzoic acid efflux pump subunit AaeB [Lonsdalea populi]|uniref:p-hydroxybenzoic acid efflux pump subunit AaeB n=3 Tax=Lonsdalea TaxID=1082702 RepID=A0A3N0UGM6_9GAMM|nr:p-hydroxybenzoic acid efflux pump subunit AaeB [Lonsdalea populi]OSM97410.1 p-hydroxybenzoic acid efflux pump subunit AaeB [Lonsdalea populi]OSN01894.1 p-hydroxybenzoic acid efflux pump subunit AaeB [Lonsdalea populi]QPQ24000.1 p-hydroxybenzoic acid efflux pump subunit AaeB [Lonsdalea populi]RAT29799.1 p-hydroxybenzoic acid efflux pump subunit AaeB [Lonsdalea populi]RAT35209.1 p-hydroxybenzoic acid efflux pump subunit AaeB [Lonsdalea populi]
MFNFPGFIRLRFAFKLSFAILLSLMLGFYMQLETPRWAVLTAALVAAGPAFAAGGEPFSGAIRYRGLLRVLGTFIGCIGALIIIVHTARAPVVMLMLSCLWAGACVWISSLVRVENSYAFGLAGYTALIIVVTIESSPLLAPQLAVERCSEIVLGIVCAVLADLLFSPRSIKQDIDRTTKALLLDQFQLLQRCVSGVSKAELDTTWHALVRKTQALNGMRSQLRIESSRWQNSNLRLKSMVTQSWLMITQACEAYLIFQEREAPLKDRLSRLLEQPVTTPEEGRQRLRQLRYLAAVNSADLPAPLVGWVATATRYHLLMLGVQTNGRINRIEADALATDVAVKATSAETHHAMINGLRTWVATTLGCLFWLTTGWNSGSVCMVMIAVVTSLAMRLPNPLMMAKDFLVGTLFALPLGAFMFMLVLPSTQQSQLLLCLSLGLMAFIIGIEVQKRRLGSLAALVSTINIIVLDNPMTFDLAQFLDSAIGQIIGCFLAYLVILLIRDNSLAWTGRTLMNRFVFGAVSALNTGQKRRQDNYLPALYQYLFLLLSRFPGDIAKYRLALSLIIAHQGLRQLDIPISETLAAHHRHLRATAGRVIKAKQDTARSRYFTQLLEEMDAYQQALLDHRVAEKTLASVSRLIALLRRNQHAFTG